MARKKVTVETNNTAMGLIKNYPITEDMVREFHVAFGHPAPTKPTMLDKDTGDLRMALVSEEAIEAKTAKSITDLLKELCDLQYVVDGWFVSTGLDKYKAEAMMLVHKSNMSKLGEDGKPIYREDGKVLKGPNYKPVTTEQLKAVLDG